MRPASLVVRAEGVLVFGMQRGCELIPGGRCLLLLRDRGLFLGLYSLLLCAFCGLAGWASLFCSG